VSRFVVVAPIRESARDGARELVAGGPPYDLPATDLASHQVYLTSHEVVFVFEGPEARATVERLAGDPALWRTAGTWRELLAGRPRIAEEAFAWSREAGG